MPDVRFPQDFLEKLEFCLLLWFTAEVVILVIVRGLWMHMGASRFATSRESAKRAIRQAGNRLGGKRPKRGSRGLMADSQAGWN